MTKYRRLTRSDRCHIERSLSLGKRVSRIADDLGLGRSSIYREIRRGSILKGVRGGKKKGEYSSLEAHRRAISTYRDSRQTCYYRGSKIKGWVEDLIVLKLHERWSPEQIASRLRMEKGISISTEAIYKYILSMKKRGAKLHKLLRHAGRRPKRVKFRSRYWELQKQRRRSVDDRPPEANERGSTGHLERDLMLGKRGTGAVLTIVDRRSRKTFLKKLKSTTCLETNQKTQEKIQASQINCKTMTNDNGHEFGEFWELEKLINAKVYFTHPLCPWERGTVENTIGLVRQFIPKGSDLTEITEDDLVEIETILNSRPRKSLGFRTPNEFATGKFRQLITKKRIALPPPEYYEQFY
jgi:transposase, IS30 family